MSFTLDEYAEKRPYSYHNTSSSNLASIRTERQLRSAAALLNESGNSDLIRVRRIAARSVRAESKEYVLQSQRPLYQGHIEFYGGWELGDLIESINHLVFFWPGNSSGPIRPGKDHSGSSTGPTQSVVVRMSTKDLLRENSIITPLFSPYNAGSPRCNLGKKSPRGPETFQPAAEFVEGWGKVVELTFPGSVQLPESSEYKRSPNEQWEKLFC